MNTKFILNSYGKYNVFLMENIYIEREEYKIEKKNPFCNKNKFRCKNLLFFHKNLFVPTKIMVAKCEICYGVGKILKTLLKS